MMPVFPASPLRADSESPVACLRPGEEKLAALTPHGPVCPRCRNLHVVRYGKRGGIQRYKCKGCSFHFTDFTGSVLHRMRRRDPFAAHARVEQPGQARCGINHELGQSITNPRRGYRAAMEGEGSPA